MDLNEVLLKTKIKGQRKSSPRTPVYIAMDDRPYNLNDTLENKTERVKNENKETWLINRQKKLATNRQQTDNKPTTKLATNRQQTDNKKQNRQQTGNKVATELATKPTTNWQQTDNKLATNAHFSSLVGLQKVIIIFIYKECKNARSKITTELTLEYISLNLKASTGSIKTTLQRLEKKGYIYRREFKNGRSGWSRYELPDSIFRELLQLETDNKLATNWQQTDSKLATEPATELTTIASSRRSYINTTTGEDKDVQKSSIDLPSQWEEINPRPLSEIGFTKTHLLQIVKQDKLSPQMVQDSIYAFAFDLTHNNKIASIKGSALNYFMGIVRNGLPYAFPENYESPQAESMRVYLERKQASEARQAELDNKLVNAAFKDWLATLTDEKINTIVPPAFRKMNNESSAKQAALREYFRAKEWPTIKDGLLCNETIIADTPI